ncbi:MAG: tryptophan--tRNA ligase [Defluviitaleaceae bacterium]|nr:tryptophan--tRNA ligase [Defluviitaleaceae bacterium]MCL2263472.1 tryptophan--tRNA ligase [Defluviitaleaceae bacterium]
MKKIIFSGIKPTGIPTLGSLLGAMSHWEKLSSDYNCLYCVVDMHAITIRQDPKVLRENGRNLLAWLIALGLDPEKNILYFQSNVPAHAELSWILNCYTYVGELNRMTQFKDKSAKNTENINAGLYTYPVLMAADILLFQTNLVPVGEDQRQHLELCRDIAGRFNKVYGDVFAVPDAFVPPVGARIMGLQNPTDKMSKSDDNANDCIYLSDSPDSIVKKFKKAVTDSDNQIKMSEEKPGISNLLTIYACVKGITLAEAEAEFSGAGYGHFKQSVGEAVAQTLAPYQQEHARLMADPANLDAIAAKGAEKASEMALKTLAKVKNVIGFN